MDAMDVRAHRDRLFRVAHLWNQASDDFPHDYHRGRVAYVAAALGLPYGHAAALTWECFGEGLLVVRPRPLNIGDDVESWLVAQARREEEPAAAHA